MGLFKKKKSDMPKIDLEKHEPVLRASICTGEQVLCLRDRQTGAMHELMLIRTMADLEAVCAANGIVADAVQKVY